MPKFDNAVDWGMFWFFTQPLFSLLIWLKGYIGNIGLSILALTVIVKAIFFPLANKSYESISKMKKIQPQTDALKKQYEKDPAKLQQETMALYQREKINPLMGCLPMLIQIPVFYSLYKVLTVTIEMRQSPIFGWIKDLSSRDPTSIWTLFGLIPWDPATGGPSDRRAAGHLAAHRPVAADLRLHHVAQPGDEPAGAGPSPAAHLPADADPVHLHPVAVHRRADHLLVVEQPAVDPAAVRDHAPVQGGQSDRRLHRPLHQAEAGGRVSEVAHTDEAIEAARVLFARPATFVMGAAQISGLPEPDLPEVAFAGRSNVGKSSLINALVGQKHLARASNEPGRTREVNFFLLDERLRLVDLPGYGFARASRTTATKFQNLGRAYLRGRPNLRRVYLLIDARHGLKSTDTEALDALDLAAVSYQIVLTKADKLKTRRGRNDGRGAPLKGDRQTPRRLSPRPRHLRRKGRRPARPARRGRRGLQFWKSRIVDDPNLRMG